MDLILAGIGLLLMLPVWRYIVKRSLLDAHRDRLFDLRDDLRDHFYEQKWDMGGALYKQLRDLINGYLRYTENFQYSEFNYIEVEIKRNPELQAAMKAKFEKIFSDITEEQMQFVMKLRTEARRVMMSYMILSSFPLALLTLILFPIVGMYVLVGALVEAIFSTGSTFFRSAREVHGLVSIFIKIVIGKIANRLLVEELVEEYSYRQAFQTR